MFIKQALQKATGQLKKGSIKNPALEAEILLSHILKKDREFLFTYPEKELTNNQASYYKRLTSRRLKGEPVAYLTGQKEFYGLNFFVNKNVLIPRPETELMVEEALDLIVHNKKRMTLIDVGTGSGCIIISLAKQLDLRIKNYDLRMLGVDISEKVLSVAKKNAELHGVNRKIKFVHGDLLKPALLNSKFINHNSKMIILANLPYLTPTQIKSSPTVKYEPEKALDGGRDGLKYYKELFRQARQLKSLNPVSFSILCEIDPAQAGKIKKLAQSELPKNEIKIKKDLSGRNRLAIIEI
ncbi:MAG: peptide chain release factor N(5)-glutamine methyltransferase [Patescibacteria group bacterium]